MSDRSDKREYVQYLSLGLEIAIGVSIPIFAGYWLDKRIDSSPWFLLLGCLIGIAVMIGISIRIMKKSDRNE